MKHNAAVGCFKQSVPKVLWTREACCNKCAVYERDYFEGDLDWNTIGWLVCFSQPLVRYFLIRPCVTA
jgi:hypothetical protein